MKSIIAAVLFVGFLASASSLENEAQDREPFDVIVDDEVIRVAEEAIQVGNVLRECAKGLKTLAEEHQKQGNETVEYFFKKLWRGVRRVVKGAGKIIEKTAKGIAASKAADILKNLIAKKLGQYAFGDDDMSYGDMLMNLGQDVDDAGKSLIEKGILLCWRCKARKRQAELEKKLVKEFVGAF